MRNIIKFGTLASFLVIITLMFNSCNENNTGNVQNSDSNNEGLYQTFFESAEAGVKYNNSIKRISPNQSKSNSIQTDAELTFYDSWDDFNLVCSNLPKEDFEEMNVANGQCGNMGSPLNSNTSNAYVSPGDIEPGLEIGTTYNYNNTLALPGVGFNGVASKMVVVNFGSDYLIIRFTGSNTYSVGMDLFTYFRSDNMTAEIYGADGIIGTTTAYGDNAGSFWGLTSNIPITEIRIRSIYGLFEGVDNIAFGTCILDVDIDIKPGSNPNSINCQNANGNIAVAILSTEYFDALDVDHSTVRFEGASESHVDRNGVPTRHEEDVNGDGKTDLVLHFRLGSTSLTCSSTTGNLTGSTYDGQRIRGFDSVRMVNQ